MVTIYALKDNGKIFYIGQTTNIRDRMYCHKTESKLKKTKKQQRLNDILTNGRELSHEILGTCETEQGTKVERYFILGYLALGYKLVNRRPNIIDVCKGRKPIDKIFTTKDRQILQLMADDNDTKDISKKLSISTRTIEQIRGRLKKRANVKTTAGLLHHAYINKLVK